MIDVRMAPKIAIHNKNRLQFVREAVCYYCLSVFPIMNIKEWVDTEQDTAICPFCGVDTILPVYVEDDKDLMNLKKIHDYWF